MWLKCSFNPVVINYLECTLSIIAAKQYWLSKLVNVPIDQKDEIVLLFFHLVLSLRRKVDSYWITAILGRENVLSNNIFCEGKILWTPTRTSTALHTSETSAFDSVHRTSLRQLLSVCSGFECWDSLCVPPQRAALARTWQTWETVWETGSNSFTETRSRITLASSGLAPLQVRNSQWGFILKRTTPSSVWRSVVQKRRKLECWGNWSGMRFFFADSAWQEPCSQLQRLHRLDVLEAGH